MSKKVNFAMIPIKDINGNDVTIDTTKELGNLMYMQGENLAEQLSSRATETIAELVQGW